MTAMIDRNSGYGPECGAPWNLDDDNECECPRCRKRKRDEARAEYYCDRDDD